ncbi:unnamed protein product [Echinostoma caproni]|uniref:Helitron_like_N domain-containing protein n=1 Tax=Echinostoma caproni TaxID=27848 RepID=A0A183B7Z0_9TREM|nr:unnamed protein product [Echinostoma caproni]
MLHECNERGIIQLFRPDIWSGMCTHNCWSTAKLVETEWSPNVEEFRARFDPNLVEEGPNRLRNLYFTYLVELRALAKAAPYLKRQTYYTGNETWDQGTRQAVRDLLNIIQKCAIDQQLSRGKIRTSIQLNQNAQRYQFKSVKFHLIFLSYLIHNKKIAFTARTITVYSSDKFSSLRIK